jgi:hypothetical protein
MKQSIISTIKLTYLLSNLKIKSGIVANGRKYFDEIFENNKCS